MTVCTVQNLYGKALDKNVITMKIQKENFSNSFDQKSRAVTWKVNTYPTVRGFTAIGTGGDDFVQAMVVVVESVLQHQIPQGQVKQKMSSGGKYVSVNIGPVQVVSSEQILYMCGTLAYDFILARVALHPYIIADTSYKRRYLEMPQSSNSLLQVLPTQKLFS
ncbi:putative YbeD-like domain superfamily protein, partial [Tanacetum coccineum]